MIARWPALMAIALCIVALIVADQRDRVVTSDVSSSAVERAPMPVASAPDSLGSSWYCAAGIIDPLGNNSHVIALTNPSDEATSGRLTVFPSVADGVGGSTRGEPVERLVNLPANGQQRLAIGEFISELDPVMQAAVEINVAVLIEFDLAGIIAEHVVTSPLGADSGPCASSAASNWYFATSTTTRGVRDLLALFNPFAGSAVVDITFATDGGVREPGAYDGLVIPGRSVLVIDAASVVTVNDQMSVAVEARAGRFVAERLQFFGSEPGPRGLSVALGVSDPGLQWFFPAGRSIDQAGESYVIYNPGDRSADIDFEVRLDASQENGEIPPFTINVPPRQRVVVVIDDTPTHPVSDIATVQRGDRVPEGVGYWAAVRSFNQTPVVVEQMSSVPLQGRSGVTAVVGAPLASTTQRIAVPVTESLRAMLAVLNPAGDTIARVTVTAVGGQSGEGDELAELELSPRSRGVVDLSDIPPDALSLVIEATTPVIAQMSAFSDDAAVGSIAVPDADTTSVPTLLSF